jgi:hypothetical protein
MRMLNLLGQSGYHLSVGWFRRRFRPALMKGATPIVLVVRYVSIPHSETAQKAIEIELIQSMGSYFVTILQECVLFRIFGDKNPFCASLRKLMIVK